MSDNPLAARAGEPIPAVAVAGTNLVIDYGSHEAATAAMDRIYDWSCHCAIDEPWYSGAPLSAWSATVRDEARARTALLDQRLAELRSAAIAVDDALNRWMDRHYMREYPFQSAEKALHEAIYGHPRGSAINPCEACRVQKVTA